MTERAMTGDAEIGTIVHLMHMGCHPAIVLRVNEGIPLLRVLFPTEEEHWPGTDDIEVVEGYNSLHSARPTSGWHWIEEHDEA